ncbi:MULTISPECIES: hypothetical protein [unclassified Crossiella]|uniref:hypothetical protein n=1 Tax=unclassified Crossiella TaxID=2620835 RepID=UPI001FFE41D6|nr:MULTISPECIES: hypothetical protein [unclassified Crossiella]MCK2240686.1 hypothetical protein [Crossiella sp. S99.2]MCK2252863.1 hypothetical protein [Crossiella sp. S99.1]
MSTASEPAHTLRHNPECSGCHDYAVLLAREIGARRAFYQAGVSHADALAAFRRGVIGYLKGRHPLRTERLKKDGFPLGPNTTESTLLAAMAQWDQMRDGELRHSAENAVRDELHALRARNAELEGALAKHTEHRNADQAVYLERLHHYEEQAQRLTSQLSECANDRRELSRGAVRLADHIAAGGGTLPTLFRRPDWYRRWAETGPAKPIKRPTTTPPDKPKPTSAPGPTLGKASVAPIRNVGVKRFSRIFGLARCGRWGRSARTGRPPSAGR